MLPIEGITKAIKTHDPKKEIKINDFNIPINGIIKVATFLRTNPHFKTNFTTVEDNINISHYMIQKYGGNGQTFFQINDLIAKINRRIIRRGKEKAKLFKAKECKVVERGARIVIPVMQLEFTNGGNTIWVQGIAGTTLRIKTIGKIITDQCKDSPISHCDILIQDDIKFCISKDVI